jgi:DNA-binding CsgD family transcriptional regulator
VDEEETEEKVMAKKTAKEKRKLSKRELQVLKLICKELSPGVAARKLKIHEKTFHSHRSHLLTKTNSKTNIGLLRYSICAGLFQDRKLKPK